MAGRVAESTTENIPLVGAVGYHAMWNQRAALAEEPACTSRGSSSC